MKWVILNRFCHERKSLGRTVVLLSLADACDCHWMNRLYFLDGNEVSITPMISVSPMNPIIITVSYKAWTPFLWVAQRWVNVPD